MKKIFILPALFIALSASCGGANAGKDGNTGGSAASGNASSGKGTITCVIDGKPVSITVQNSFFPMTLDTDSKGPNDGLELLDGSAKKEGFQFEIKDHGTTNIRGGADNIFCIISYYDPGGAAYSGTDAVVTVTSYSGSHLTGTFSGKFKKYGGDKTIAITDGKFDLQQ